MSLLLNGLLILCLQAAGTGAEAAAGAAQAAAAAAPAAVADQAAPAAAEAAAAPAPAETPAQPPAAAAPVEAPAAAPATAAADTAADTAAAATGEVTTADEKALPPAAAGPGSFVVLLLVIGILVLPFVIGNFVAKSLNVPEWTGRISVVILTLFLGVSPFLMSLLKSQPLSERFRLGIDLAGGTNMVFQVRGEGKEITSDVMDQMVGAVSRRINQSGTEEITVRAVGTDRIEVIVPGEDPQTVDDIKRRITRLGSLEFFVVANRADSDIIRLAQGLDLSRKDVLINGEVRARWVPAAEKNGEPKLLTDSDVISRPLKAEREVNGRVESYDTQEYLLLVSPKEEQVTGQYLRSAVRDFDPQNGEIVVSFAFDQTGAYLFGQLTGRNVPRDGVPNRRLAIVLDGRVDSAPFIREQITSRGQISGGQGGFSAEEASELVAVLNAGALEVPIDPKPLSEATVDPTLGADVRQKGVTATAISGLAVIVFMLVYYRFSGLIAVISLILNLVLTVGLMVAIPATFTLPGIAGLVLTIGMAVDANVLIYERMREEIARGSSTRVAIQNGFEKAFITIFDSNVTTLLTSVVLFYFGTDQIRGFAVTLFIGLAVSMYTALYVGRLLFDVFERIGLLKQIRMMQAIGETNLDFMKYRNHLFTASGLLIAVGLLFFAGRGERNYDIDFTGGQMVSFQTTEPQKTDDVSAVLQQEFGDDFALERLSVGEDSGEGTGKYFRLRTTSRETQAENADAQVSAEDIIRERVNKAFSAGNSTIRLRMVSLEASPVQAVAVDAADNSVAAVARMKFKDGSESALKFSEELAFGTATDLVNEALSEVRKADSGDLFGLEGTAGSGLAASERSVKKFSEFTVRVLPDVTGEQLTQALTAVQQQLAATPLFDEVNTFASAVAQETRVDATVAVLLSILGISAYIWFRFQNLIFGLAAVVSLLHDVLITLGSLAVASTISGTALGDVLLIDDFRINLSMIAAFLTLVGYSLNDTIVVFDRIREVRGKNPLVTSAIVNTSLNQTLGRTLMTGVTVFIVVVILYVFGGSGVHGFAWCLLVGSIAGTYSSVYIASPFLVWFLGQSKAVKA